MTATIISKLITAEEFRAWYPNDGKRYELIKGEIREVRPVGPHEEVAGFMTAQFWGAISAGKLPYILPRTCAIEPAITTGESDSYSPDVVVLNIEKLDDEPLWKSESTIKQGESVVLVVEVVSTNWQDDYLTKLRDYEMMGIAEYWLVDYAALGAIRYIGKPKRPTITVYTLVEGEYQMKQFQEGDQIESAVFPDLKLSVNAILAAARI
jgi:Uma2 family endonuclease